MSGNHKELIQAVWCIEEYYGDKKAERSRVPLINHIYQGMRILKDLGVSTILSPEVYSAWCIHPILQSDLEMEKFFTSEFPVVFSAMTIFLAVEYRNVANNYLSPEKANPYQSSEPHKSPIHWVNKMLIADKVQNRKDFAIYHKGKHPHSESLEQYFKDWMVELGVSEADYQRYKIVAKNSNRPDFMEGL